MSRISIAIATYNGEQYLKKQLYSILNQTRQPDEVIICDDRSQDKTLDIIKNFIEENKLTNWNCFTNEFNLGYKKNFYNAISKTTGDIIFLSDQDDIWDTNKLEIMEKLFESNSNIYSINSSFDFINDHDELIFVPCKKHTSNHSLIFKNLKKEDFIEISELEVIKGNISPGCTMAFTSTVKDYYLKNTKKDIPHDLEINIYAAKLGKLYFYNKPLISYRVHSSNVIGQDINNSSYIEKINNKKHRFMVLNEQELFLDFLINNYSTESEQIKKYILNFKRYIFLRSEVLEQHKISSWFKMLKYFKFFVPYITVKQLTVDLIYAIKKYKSGVVKMSKFKFIETDIKDVYIIEPTVFGDNRGYFMETYNHNEFKEAGLDMNFVQDNQSKSKKGVLRGLHFQTQNSQGKLVRVIKGEVFDVAVDLRKDSDTFGKWTGVILNEENKKQFYIPENFAHGFLVLSDEAEFVYKCTNFYDPSNEGGLMWNDENIDIKWPIKDDMDILLSEKDKVHPTFKEYCKGIMI